MPSKRQIEAFCNSCNGGSDEDCEDQACPLYPDCPYATLEPIPWWDLPKRIWETAEWVARIEHRLLPRPEPSEAQKEAHKAAANRLRKIHRRRRKEDV